MGELRIAGGELERSLVTPAPHVPQTREQPDGLIVVRDRRDRSQLADVELGGVPVAELYECPRSHEQSRVLAAVLEEARREVDDRGPVALADRTLTQHVQRCRVSWLALEYGSRDRVGFGVALEVNEHVSAVARGLEIVGRERRRVVEHGERE